MQALKIIDLHKTYPGDVQALKGISLDVAEGDFFALLGPNGAGKSTTIAIITSLIKKTSGQVKVFDHDLDLEPQWVKSKIGLVPQEFNFHIFQKVIHILVGQAGYYGIKRKLAYERAELYLKKLDLWHKRDTQARFLSGGQKRRLMIARALVHQPPLLILDEPTAGVDIELRRSMWQFLREINAAGTTIILTTHYLEEAENLCRNIAIINHGQLIEHASMQDVLKKLHTETFILYLDKPVFEPPKIENYPLRKAEEGTLELDIHEGQDITTALLQLSHYGIKVLRLRNKVNRLEELFVRMTTDNNHHEHSTAD